MTASLRRRSCSPAAGPLDDEDLLCEILIRLPPDPSSLPRASAVCKRWRHLVSDPGFRRRFRLRHRRNPPLLGYFDRFQGVSFRPTLEAPNRVPPERFAFQCDDGDRFCCRPLGCRHGLVLILLQKRLQVLVWNPVTGYQHRFDVPRGFGTDDANKSVINGAVLRAAGDIQHFQVVLVVADNDDKEHRRAVACVYSSETGQWGSFISTPLPYQAYGSTFPTFVYRDDAVLAGDSVYWVLAGNLDGILEFDLEKQRLAVIQVPVDMCGRNSFQLMRTEGGVVGFIYVSDSDCCTAQLWKRMTDRDGAASWGLARTIELDNLLSLKPEEKKHIVILGFAEDNNAVLLWTVIGLFMIHLESLKFKKLLIYMAMSHAHPFESVYTAETCAGGGHNGPELLLNT